MSLTKEELKTAVKEALAEFLKENSFAAGLRTGPLAPPKGEYSGLDELGRVYLPYVEYLRARYKLGDDFPAKKFFLKKVLVDNLSNLTPLQRNHLEVNVAAAGFEDNRAVALIEVEKSGWLGKYKTYEHGDTLMDTASYGEETVEEVVDRIERRILEKQAQEGAGLDTFVPK